MIFSRKLNNSLINFFSVVYVQEVLAHFIQYILYKMGQDLLDREYYSIRENVLPYNHVLKKL